jgi:hypothetical protein
MNTILVHNFFSHDIILHHIILFPDVIASNKFGKNIYKSKFEYLGLLAKDKVSHAL